MADGQIVEGDLIAVEEEEAALTAATIVLAASMILRMFCSWTFVLEDFLAATASRSGGARAEPAKPGASMATLRRTARRRQALSLLRLILLSV